MLHVDNISGIPALMNAVLGKTSAPNQVQPRWVLEGLAVALETEHTGGGRLRSSPLGGPRESFLGLSGACPF